MPHTSQSNSSFYSLGIAPKILEVLDRNKFTIPTPIQHKAIPVCIEGSDIIGVAQTGTGKTLAFAIPIIQRLAQRKGKALVLVPTRELAIQVDETFQKLAPIFSMRTAVLIGGASMHNQIQALRGNPRVLVATPGRLVDHMEQRTVMLADVNILVLDEADRMLDMGFLPQIEKILRSIPKDRQTMLFSATIPGDVVRIATSYMKLPIHIEVAPSGTTAERITQELFIVKKEDKGKLLSKILKQYSGSVLLFSRTKRGASKITRALRANGWRAAEIHSDKSLPQRREALEGFKSGKYRILVATDIAARGIDVIGIELVINYDLPEDAENYVHRIGRTGRAGHEGHAIAIATPDQAFEVRSIEKLIKTALPIAEHPEIPKESFQAINEDRPAQKYGRQQHGHSYRSPRSGGNQRHFGRSSSRPSGHSRKHF
ncbi:MAG: DEAD/DEAH box helicase [Candidatus Omnitrophota bacterium]|nr:DEAD/DEAH box helicase [Candidatus Omnitrophota bacterium]